MASFTNTVTPAATGVDPGFNIGGTAPPNIGIPLPPGGIPSAGSSTTLGGAYGGVPAAVDPQGAQNAAIGGNLSNLSNLYQLATGAGAASGAGGSANLNTALPGASAGLNQELQLAQSDLAGNLSPGTLNNLEQVAAERGVSTGDIGSPNSNAALLQALGLTTEQLQQTGVQDLSQAIASAPVGPQFNPQSQLLTPAEDISAQQVNSSNAAQPNPAAAAAANMAALQSGLLAGKVQPKVGVLPTGSTGGFPGGGGGNFGGISPGDAFMNSPDGNYGSVIGYGPGGNAGTDLTGGAPGTGAGAGTYGGIPTGSTVGNASYDPTGATTFAQDFPGQQLQPGQVYNPQTGMISDQNAGTQYDPNTGLTFSLETGEVVPDTGEPAYAGGGGGDEGGGDYGGDDGG